MKSGAELFYGGKSVTLEYDKCLKRGKIKTFSRGRGLVAKELGSAEADLQRARKTWEDGDYKWATVQLYYSMFHSARALLYFHNLSEKSHYCLIEAVRTLYVVPKKVPVSLLESFQQAKQLREEDDYYNRWSEEGCLKLLKDAEVFHQKAVELTLNTE